MNWDTFVSALDEIERERLSATLYQCDTREAVKAVACYTLTPEERLLANSGRRIDAIKSVRSRLGLRLLHCQALVNRETLG